jgi:hypothetical protein
LAALLGLTVCSAAASAATLDIEWYTVDGGGATFSTGGTFTLGATIGQPDAGTMTGGTFTLVGGFWGVSGVTIMCDGDANGDGMVDPLDSGYVLSRFGCNIADPDCQAADVNDSGIVDPLDVGYVASRFGTCD